MKNLLLALSLMFCVFAKAQTFYEVSFNNPNNEEDEWVGLMIYYDDQNCKVRLINNEALSENTVYESIYSNQMEDKQSKDDVGVMFYMPEDEEFPYFIWMWEKDDASDMNEKPYVTFDINDSEQWFEANDFSEISLSDMDEEYISQFYGEDEDEYKMMLEAISTVKEQKTEKIDYSQYDFTDASDVEEEATEVEQEADANTTPTSDNADENTPIAKGRNTLSFANIAVVSKPAAALVPTLHLVMTANTEVSDIGQACKVDLDNMRSEMKGIAKVLGLQYKETLVYGENYSKNSLADAIKNLTPASNDVVVFAYSGHGFRFSDQKDYYPNMDMSSSSYDDPSKNFVALSDVYSEITKKGARLNLVFSDCCNSKIDASRPVLSTNSLFSRSNNSFDLEKLKTLFLGSKGNLLATAASPGEFSWCGVKGGFFMLSLIESMRLQISAVNSEEPSWNNIVKNAINSAATKTANNSACKKQNGLKYVQVKAVKSTSGTSANKGTKTSTGKTATQASSGKATSGKLTPATNKSMSVANKKR